MSLSKYYYFSKDFRFQSGEHAEQQVEGGSRQVESQQVLHWQEPGRRQSPRQVSTGSSPKPSASKYWVAAYVSFIS